MTKQKKTFRPLPKHHCRLCHLPLARAVDERTLKRATETVIYGNDAVHALVDDMCVSCLADIAHVDDVNLAIVRTSLRRLEKMARMTRKARAILPRVPLSDDHARLRLMVIERKSNWYHLRENKHVTESDTYTHGSAELYKFQAVHRHLRKQAGIKGMACKPAGFTRDEIRQFMDEGYCQRGRELVEQWPAGMAFRDHRSWLRVLDRHVQSEIEELATHNLIRYSPYYTCRWLVNLAYQQFKRLLFPLTTRLILYKWHKKGQYAVTFDARLKAIGDHGPRRSGFGGWENGVNDAIEAAIAARWQGPPRPPEHLNNREVADYLGFSTQQYKRLVKKGHWPKSNGPGVRWLDMIAWKNAGGITQYPQKFGPKIRPRKAA